MIAKPIVNGFAKEMKGRVDVVHVNLLSPAGRELGSRYGVKIVPTSLLFDRRGELVTRVSGLPDKEALITRVEEGEVEIAS